MNIIDDFGKLFHLFWNISWNPNLFFLGFLDDLLLFGDNSLCGSKGSFELGLLLHHLVLLLSIKSLIILVIRLNINNAFAKSLSFTFSSRCWTPDSYTGDVLRNHVSEGSLVLINLHLRGFNNLISNGFLHEIDLRLPDDLHHLVLQGNGQLANPDSSVLILLGSASQSLYASGSTSLGDLVGHK